jgi:hypothetical protein
VVLGCLSSSGYAQAQVVALGRHLAALGRLREDLEIQHARWTAVVEGRPARRR